MPNSNLSSLSSVEHNRSENQPNHFLLVLDINHMPALLIHAMGEDGHALQDQPAHNSFPSLSAIIYTSFVKLKVCPFAFPFSSKNTNVN